MRGNLDVEWGAAGSAGCRNAVGGARLDVGMGMRAARPVLEVATASTEGVDKEDGDDSECGNEDEKEQALECAVRAWSRVLHCQSLSAPHGHGRWTVWRE
jgi:hypothetical protein